MTAGKFGVAMLILGIVGAGITILGYCLALARPQIRRFLWIGRIGYALSALGTLATFGILAGLVYYRQYQYIYVWQHTGNELHGWYRLAATWSAQEGSFLLWAAWSAIIGFMVLTKAGKYEARVMPFFVSVLAFLCMILLKQTPFTLVPPPTSADFAANPGLHFPALDGQGLTPSLVNYWMTIHPPTIFFGFASLAVPFCYAIAALLWKDYDGWMSRVMPYSLLSCATLGLGLFMGGYWAYETQGWHGFWAWDPVENASFFPWLAVTALVHGAVVQRSRGGMARINTFLGLFAFWLFLLGTFLTRSGALSGKDASGQMLSVHAFDNISKSALSLMIAMMVVYGVGGLVMWLVRLPSMPHRKAVGETIFSRDFAFFLAVTLLVVACFVVMMGTTTPLALSLMHRPPTSPKPAFYNKVMLPLSLITALLMGCVPWLAWKKTKPETFAQKLIVPWIGMLVFGFFMVFWVQGAERNLMAVSDVSSTEVQETMRAWINPMVQRIAVVSLASFGFLAALSNAMLAYRVFRSKPLAAGGWLAHVGIGVLMIGVIVSNTYERTTRITLKQGDPPVSAFGYQLTFEKMTGKPWETRPLNPDYDRTNAIRLRITPPGVNGSAPSSAGIDGTPRTFTADLSWFVHNMKTEMYEDKFERMRWPSIQRTVGHDLYIGIADDPGFNLPVITLKPKEKRDIGPYVLGYFDNKVIPQQYFGVQLVLKTQDGKIVMAHPGFEMLPSSDPAQPFEKLDKDVAVPELRDENGVPGAIYLKALSPGTREATLLLNLPQYAGHWEVPLEVTYKPWVNLVWSGVLITVMGTLLAMFRRALDARKISGNSGMDGHEPQPDPSEPWEDTGTVDAALGVQGLSPIQVRVPTRKRQSRA